MSDKPKLNRRDWFRLRLPHQGNSVGAAHVLGQTTNADRPNGLKLIEHPPNHDGMNLDDLPPLREAILSDPDVAALLSDIQCHATDIQLMQKRATKNSRASVDTAPSLDAVRELFLNGTVSRLQIRYRWQNSLWIDTLARQPGAIRLVRVSHQTD